MKPIRVSILGKQYPLKVEEHEEQEMTIISRFVDERFHLYREQLVKQPESTVMVLAALSIAEELFEARKNSNELEKGEERLMDRVNLSLERLIEDIKK